MPPEIRGIIITVSDQSRGQGIEAIMLMAIYTLPTLLIPGPFNLGLFGSSSLVPKQRAVTSTGAYVLMDLRSALDGSGKSLARFYWLQRHCVSERLVLSCAGGLRAASGKPQASSHKHQVLDSQENVGYKI